jgi:hypothetical protein
MTRLPGLYAQASPHLYAIDQGALFSFDFAHRFNTNEPLKLNDYVA